jgi:hypothetical protein
LQPSPQYTLNNQQTGKHKNVSKYEPNLSKGKLATKQTLYLIDRVAAALKLKIWEKKHKKASWIA